MLIKNILKKFNVADFYFVQLPNGKVTLTVQLSPLDAIDLKNNKEILAIGNNYKKPLTDYVSINEEKISILKAKRLAKPFYSKFADFVEEQDYLANPNKFRLKTKVDHSLKNGKYESRPNDIIVEADEQ